MFLHLLKAAARIGIPEAAIETTTGNVTRPGALPTELQPRPSRSCFAGEARRGGVRAAGAGGGDARRAGREAAGGYSGGGATGGGVLLGDHQPRVADGVSRPPSIGEQGLPSH